MKRRALVAVVAALLSFSREAAADSLVTLKDVCMPSDGTGLMLRMEVESQGVLKAVVWGQSRSDLLSGRRVLVDPARGATSIGRAEFCAGTECSEAGAELSIIGKSPVVSIRRNDGAWHTYPVRVTRESMDKFLCG